MNLDSIQEQDIVELDRDSRTELLKSGEVVTRYGSLMMQASKSPLDHDDHQSRITLHGATLSLRHSRMLHKCRSTVIAPKRTHKIASGTTGQESSRSYDGSRCDSQPHGCGCGPHHRIYFNLLVSCGGRG